MTRGATPSASAASSAELRNEALDLFPGGVNSPVRAYRAVGGEPPIIVSGRGALVRDADGRTYLDYVGAFGPLILGHAEPAVVDAAIGALAAGGPFGATAPGEIELGRRIREAMPAIERVRFVSSGTEAVMSALRVARGATGRDLVLKFDGGYHGHSDGLLVEAGSGLATLGLPASAGVSEATASTTLVAPYNDLRAVASLLADHADRVAAILVEPVAANMGVVAPEPGFLAGLRRLASEAGALLVFDEVITGFRVARGGAQGRYRIEPDITCLGKIIGGGMPIGAYGGRASFMHLVAPSGPVYQAGTLSGHPVAMAAGAATIDRLDDALYAELERRAARLEEGIAEVAAAAGRPASVARVGSLLTVFFTERPPRDYAEARRADTARFGQFHRSMRNAGILLPPSQFEAWFVSAAHSDEDIERTIEAAAEAFRA